MDEISFALEQSIGVIRKVSRDLFNLVSVKLRRYTGNMNFAASLMIGFGMLGRAELAFVVMDIAYVQNPILTDHAFYTLMFTAFWLNIAVPLSIRWWKPYYLRTNPQVEAGDSG